MSNSRRGFEMNVSIIFAITLCYLLESNGKIYGEQISIEDLKLSPNVDDKFDQDYDKRASPGGMWFGPRLGKRTKGFQGEHSSSVPLQRLLIEAMAAPPQEAGSAYGFSGSKRRFTPRLGRDSSEQDIIGPSKSVDFIPRLGRELTPALLKTLLYGNEMNQYGMYGRAISEDRPTLTETKIPPFAPRLGREIILPLQNDFYGKN